MGYGLLRTFHHVGEESFEGGADVVILHGENEVECLATELLHRLHGVLDAAVRLGKADELHNLVVRHMTALDPLHEVTDVVVCRRVHGVDGREGELPFEHVVAGRLAQFGAFVVVEDVVLDLEADADLLADAPDAMAPSWAQVAKRTAVFLRMIS